MNSIEKLLKAQDIRLLISTVEPAINPLLALGKTGEGAYLWLVHLFFSSLVNTTFAHIQQLLYNGKICGNIPAGCLTVSVEIMLPHHTIKCFTPVK